MNRTFKRLLRLTPLLVLLLAAGCNKSRSIYDLEKGVDPEVTLFWNWQRSRWAVS